MLNAVYLLMFFFVMQDAPPTNADKFASLTGRARFEYWKGHLAQSEALFTAALAVPSIAEAERAHALADLGDVYINEDKLRQGEQAYRESLAMYKKLKNDLNAALQLRNLGAVYSLQRRDDEALSVLRQALKLARGAPQADTSFIAQVLNSIGIVYYRQGKLSKAEQLFTEGVMLLPPASGIYGPADLLNNLGAIYHARRQYDKAEEYLTKALSIIEGQVGRDHPDLTFTLSSLAILYTDSRQFAKAEQQYRRALSLLESDPATFQTRIARLLQGLSRTYIAAGRYADAEAALSEAAAIARQQVGLHPDMARIMDDYAERLGNNGRVKEAEELRGEARRARVAGSLVINAHDPF